jgi:hypothetical protein
MEIALCLFGKFRTFEHNYKNILNTFSLEQTKKIDIFVSTWFENEFDCKKKLKSLLPDYAKIEVEHESKKVTDAINLFGSIYPQSYKIRKVLNLMLNSSKKYDLVILSRMDVVYLDKFNPEEYDMDTLYTSTGYINKSTQQRHTYWKKKIYPVTDYFHIYSVDKNADHMPYTFFVKPVCDQFYVGSPFLLDKYASKVELIEYYLDAYNAFSLKSKKLQKYLYLVFAFLKKNISFIFDTKWFFYLYRAVFKKYGFYMPFSDDKDIFSSRKPNINSYQFAFRGIKNSICSMRYSIIRSADVTENNSDKKD